MNMNEVARLVSEREGEMVEADALWRLGQVVWQELNGVAEGEENHGLEARGTSKNLGQDAQGTSKNLGQDAQDSSKTIPVYAGVPVYRPWDAQPVEQD